VTLGERISSHLVVATAIQLGRKAIDALKDIIDDILI